MFRKQANTTKMLGKRGIYKDYFQFWLKFTEMYNQQCAWFLDPEIRVYHAAGSLLTGNVGWYLK